MTLRLLHDLDTGTFHPPLRRRLLHARGPGGEPELVTRVLVFETARDGLVLVDAGFGVRDAESPAERLGSGFVALAGPQLDPARTPALVQLRAAGIQATDVRHIVMTHLDLDHAGGLGDFPHAQVYVHRTEFDTALARRLRSHRERYRAAHLAHEVRWVPLDGLAGNERTHSIGGLRFAEAEGLPAGFHYTELFGHTPGHTGWLVDADDARLFHLGDAFLEAEELVEPERRRSVATRLHHRLFDDDPARARVTRGELREFAERERATRLVCTHDAAWIEARA